MALPLEKQLQTLVLLNDELKYRLQLQREAIDRTDTKTTLLTGLIAVGSQVLVANRDRVGAVWLGFSLAAAALAMASGLWSIRLRPYFDVPKADALVAKYGHSSPEHVLAALAGTRVIAVERNSKSHRRRVILWWACLVFLAATVLLATIGFLRGAK